MQEACDATYQTAGSDTVSTYQVPSVQLVTNKKLEAADTRSRTPLISFFTVQLRALCVPPSLATLCLSTTSGPDPGELPGFWGSIVFHHALIPRKGSGNQ